MRKKEKFQEFIKKVSEDFKASGIKGVLFIVILAVYLLFRFNDLFHDRMMQATLEMNLEALTFIVLMFTMMVYVYFCWKVGILLDLILSKILKRKPSSRFSYQEKESMIKNSVETEKKGDTYQPKKRGVKQ